MEQTALETPYELFGIECGDGWKHLYQPIIDKVNEYNKEHKDNPLQIDQIKEKFGELRIYLSYHVKEIEDMIAIAEEKSHYTCEICGKTINEPIVKNHWIYPMCEECFNK